jgi:hypothetical protein
MRGKVTFCFIGSTDVPHTTGESDMTQMIKKIAAALNVPTEKTEIRFSRGIGPRVAPKHRRW